MPKREAAIITSIRKIREEQFLTQDYMAYCLKMGQNAYSKIELGKTKLTVSHLLQIADILKIDVRDLLAEALQ